MKLRNKKSGEVVDYISFEKGGGQISMFVFDTNQHYYYNSLTELNEEWEDWEEPKEYYYLNEYLELDHEMWTGTEFDNKLKAIGNYFETKEEAEKAVEKLKAWKRLKDKNFHFLKYSALGCGEIEFSLDFEDMDDEGEIGQLRHDLNLLFGGEQ